MIQVFHAWLRTYVDVWLFYVLAFEGIFSLGSFIILIVEYFYDKEIEESKRQRKRRHKKNRVKIVIDSDGQAVIEEAPKGLDIAIEHEGERK